jgi:hypothetical protein
MGDIGRPIREGEADPVSLPRPLRRDVPKEPLPQKSPMPEKVVAPEREPVAV